MLKRIFSIFFTVIFMAFTLLPSIAVMVDDSIDISVLLNISEEEEERKGKNKEIEIFVIQNQLDTNLTATSEKVDNLGYFDKKYSNPYLNIILPPPDFS